MAIAKNPILPGFRPDPSICRVGEDYYIVNSSFAYFPGVPIYHSKNLADWKQVGNVLDRPSQLPLEESGHSRGIFAPTIRYNRGIFYMITTNVSAGGTFIVTAENAAGPWSEPYYLGEAAEGIDPSLFFDTAADGSVRCYYVGTRPNRKGVRYNGDWEIYLQELDLEKMQLCGEGQKIWKGAMHHVIWPEGPHLYKKGDYYYLMHAEGGTGDNHCVAIARSKELYGPYEGNPNNPILTHRHLGKEYPITAVGHGDLVEGPLGQWYMVMLASRKCEGYVNTGRDTFLAKVAWEDDWPVVNPGVGKLEDTVIIDGVENEEIKQPSCYHFYEKQLPPEWLMLRNAAKDIYEFHKTGGGIRLYGHKATLQQERSPSYLAIRQESNHFWAGTCFSMTTDVIGAEAGLALVCDDENQVRFSLRKSEGGWELVVIQVLKGVSKELAKRKVETATLELGFRAQGQLAECVYAQYQEEEQTDRTSHILCNQVDLRGLSTELAGGFTGCTIGMYISTNGVEEQKQKTYADFAWFSYENL